MSLQYCFEHIRSAVERLGLSVASVTLQGDSYVAEVIVPVSLGRPAPINEIETTANRIAEILANEIKRLPKIEKFQAKRRRGRPRKLVTA